MYVHTFKIFLNVCYRSQETDTKADTESHREREKQLETKRQKDREI